jgi:hypothetical protein
MTQFLDLPRELRDMVYTEALTSCRPLPTLRDTQSTSGWYRPWEPRTGLGDHGCALSSRRAPSTCANLLACNRQINAEMMQAVERGRQTGRLAALIDCIAKDEMHYFTWLAIPLVITTTSEQEPGKSSLSKVMPSWAVEVLAATDRVQGSVTTSPTHHRATTIEQLWIDVRLFDPSASTATACETPRDRASWAICAALKHIVEHNPDNIPTRSYQNAITIDEVILNVVPQSSVKVPNDDGESLFIPESQSSSPAEELLHELVNVWNKLWAGNSFKARYYRTLLEKIKRVRVCLNGETFRIRELAVELERGQAERRRINMRNEKGLGLGEPRPFLFVLPLLFWRAAQLWYMKGRGRTTLM